jgi:hypothetical protein
MRVAGACTLCILASGTLVLNAGSHPAAPTSRESLVCADPWTSAALPAEILERFLANTSQSLVSYKALRRLTVVARGGKMEALLTAHTSLDPDKGFSYEVLEESGSGFLRTRVLHPVLEAERMAKLREKGAHGALTEANYKFTAGEMTGDGFLRVAIKPKRKDELLMDGSILLTCADSDLVRMEGLLVKRPSFWTRKVQIVRRYGRIGGVRVPLTTGSTADVLFAGQSTFSMSYEYESINGVPVASGEAETARPDPTARR